MSHQDKYSQTRRRLLQGAAGTSALLLAGCTGQTGSDGTETETSGDTEQTTTSSNDGNSGGESAPTVTFWTTNTETDRIKVIREVVSSFESSHDSDIELRSVPENDLPTQISAARAAGNLPTIGEWGLGPMQQLGSGGLLSKEAAGNLIDAIGEDEFYQGALELTAAPEGGNFGVPHSGWLEGFWYSKGVFEENGLDAPTTWDSLLTAAETLHNPDENQFGIVVGTKKTAFARQCFTPFARSNGARVFNKDGEIVFDSPEMVEALEFYAKLAEYTPPGRNTWKTANNTYLNDQCHLIEYSTFIMGDVVEKGQEMVDDTAFAPYVENKRKSSFGQIVTMSLLESASQAQLQGGVDFGKHVLTGDQYVKWLHMTKGGAHPVIKSTAESDAYKESDVLQAWGDTVEDVSAGFENIERFGYVDGKSFPELGQITNKFLIAEAVVRVTSGEDPETVASEQAEKMRSAIQG